VYAGFPQETGLVVGCGTAAARVRVARLLLGVFACSLVCVAGRAEVGVCVWREAAGCLHCTLGRFCVGAVLFVDVKIHGASAWLM
jgi:hypothetical protein